MTNELEIEVRLTLERLSKNVPQTERPGFHEFLGLKGRAVDMVAVRRRTGRNDGDRRLPQLGR